MNRELLAGIIAISLVVGIGIGYFMGKGNGSSLPGAPGVPSEVKFTSGLIKQISGSRLMLDSGWNVDVSGVQVMKAGKPIAFSEVKTGMVASFEFKKNLAKGNVSASDVQSVVISIANTGGPLLPGQSVVLPSGPYNPPK